MEIKMNGSHSLEDYFLKFIYTTTCDLLYTEFKEFHEKWSGYLHFKTKTGSETLFDNVFKGHKGHITKDYVRTQFKRYAAEKESSSTMYATFQATERSGILCIDQFAINVSTVGLDKMILSRITDLERLKRLLVLSIRHEIGHLIDFSRFNDKPVKEYCDYANQNEKELADYRRWKDEDTNHDWKESLTRYYDITIESNANRNGHVDFEEFLDFEKLPSTNKSIVLEINTLENKS